MFEISTQEELDKINEDHFSYNPEDRSIKWSGCNYYIGSGKIWQEAVGTAQSMHDCEGCDRYDSCKVKQDTPVWFYNVDIRTKLDKLWKEMQN